MLKIQIHVKINEKMTRPYRLIKTDCHVPLISNTRVKEGRKVKQGDFLLYRYSSYLPSIILSNNT